MPDSQSNQTSTITTTGQPNSAQPQQIDPNAIPQEQKSDDLAALMKSKVERHKDPTATDTEATTSTGDLANPFRG